MRADQADAEQAAGTNRSGGYPTSRLLISVRTALSDSGASPKKFFEYPMSSSNPTVLIEPSDTPQSLRCTSQLVKLGHPSPGRRRS
mgnify:CR=1 FL=1